MIKKEKKRKKFPRIFQVKRASSSPWRHTSENGRFFWGPNCRAFFTLSFPPFHPIIPIISSLSYSSIHPSILYLLPLLSDLSLCTYISLNFFLTSSFKYIFLFFYSSLLISLLLFITPSISLSFLPSSFRVFQMPYARSPFGRVIARENCRSQITIKILYPSHFFLHIRLRKIKNIIIHLILQCHSW